MYHNPRSTMMIALLSVLSDSSSDDSVGLIFAARKNSRHYFGKPNEVYCNSTFEFCLDNQFVPIENILGIGLALTLSMMRQY